MRSTINFMDANYQKIKQMRVQNEKQYAPKIPIPSNGKLTPLRSPNFHFWVLKQGIKKVKLLQVIGCITTGLDPTRKTFVS
jgi:hypothetical protein